MRFRLREIHHLSLLPTCPLASSVPQLLAACGFTVDDLLKIFRTQFTKERRLSREGVDRGSSPVQLPEVVGQERGESFPCPPSCPLPDASIYKYQ
ncbi:hypothetical protein KIL84_008904 [Mauremys mutica]|uniref:Uncharacterized protein n=1 Tax=Mauremys mutica TaxID=74926 RepID=A0A9D4AY69_9SAUR|nr:hypothetical protein KIL84_008904 [Mauremys mutica]